MKRICLIGLALCLCLVVYAQGLVPKSWTAYGLIFDAPQGLRVEEDTEDTYLLNSSRFYITLQALDSDDITQEELDELLIALAMDDGVQEQTPITKYDLEQFHGLYLKGRLEDDPCYYACLMTKDAGNVFLISIMYNRTEDKVVEKILNSFKMEE
jgi:hypothetical protein